MIVVHSVTTDLKRIASGMVKLYKKRAIKDSTLVLTFDDNNALFDNKRTV